MEWKPHGRMVERAARPPSSASAPPSTHCPYSQSHPYVEILPALPSWFCPSVSGLQAGLESGHIVGRDARQEVLKVVDLVGRHPLGRIWLLMMIGLLHERSPEAWW